MADLIFVTGFEPFGESDRNFSKDLADRLAREPKLFGPDVEIATAVLPTIYSRAAEEALERLAELPRRPTLMISLGEADRPTICLETAAWNRDESGKPDNAGETRRGTPIDPAAAARRGFAFPVQAMFAALLPGDRVELSVSPGNFVCNHLSFVLTRKLTELPFTFIHVPSTKHGADLEKSSETIARLIEAALAVPGPAPRLPASRAEVEALLAAGAPNEAFLSALLQLYPHAP